MQSPSVASVAANIEAVGAPASLRAPDLLPRVSGLAGPYSPSTACFVTEWVRAQAEQEPALVWEWPWLTWVCLMLSHCPLPDQNPQHQDLFSSVLHLYACSCHLRNTFLVSHPDCTCWALPLVRKGSSCCDIFGCRTCANERGETVRKQGRLC